MVLCEKNKQIRCEGFKDYVIGNTYAIELSVNISYGGDGIRETLDSNFYVYDDVLQGRLPYVNKQSLMSCKIKHENYVCKILLKYKRECKNEN